MVSFTRKNAQIGQAVYVDALGDTLFIPESGTVSVSGSFSSISGTLYQGLELSSFVPSVETNKLYNDNGVLKFNGEIVSMGDFYSAVRGIIILDQPSGTFVINEGYTPGYLDIFYNGVKLSPSGDYIATDGSTFSLNTPAPSGTTIEYLSPFIGSRGVQGFTGSQGVQGSAGSLSIQDLQGVIGLQGVQGTQGLAGSIGINGSQGAQEYRG